MDNTAKTIIFFRKHAVDFIIGLTCVIYILWGLVTIEESGKTVWEIAAASIMSLAMGVSLSSLLGEKGLLAGYESNDFKIARNDYSKTAGIITPYIDKLDTWCELKVKFIVRRKQTKILTRARIKYETYISDEFDIKKYDKQQLKLIRKADNVKVHNMTSAHLLSDIEEDDDTDKKEITPTKFKRTETLKGIAIRVVFALAFGYFSVSMASEPSWSNIIYYTAQICIWLLFGTMQFFANYGFVMNRYSQVLYRKMNNLLEFKLWCEEKHAD